jgi:hypothetical protein
MRLVNIPEASIDWSRTAAVAVPGAHGTANMRTQQIGEIRIRLVEYGRGYLADHWCSKGHILHVVAGALTLEHQEDSGVCELSAGMSWHAPDAKGSPHRVRSENGAMIFIID